jgi:hypothetical protein
MKFLRPKGLPPLPANYSVLSLNEQIEQETRRRVQSELRARFRSETPSGRPDSVRPGAVTAAEILAAMRKANGESDEPDDDPDKQDRDDRPPRRRDDDEPGDDEDELRGPDQTRIVATPAAILAALAKAEGRR